MQNKSEEGKPLKSKQCDRFSFVTFVSRTHRKVDVFWLDYNGRRVKYGTLTIDNNTLDVTTFESHPWIFRDADTGDKLIVSGGDEIYYPKLWTGGDRTYVHIDIPVYTLKERCLQTVRQLFTEEEVKSFFIPETLKYDVKNRENIPHDVYMYFQPDI